MFSKLDIKKFLFDDGFKELQQNIKRNKKELSRMTEGVYSNRDTNPLIPDTKFRSLKVGSRLEIAKGVIAFCVHIIEDGMIWVVTSEKGSEIERHHHNFTKAYTVFTGTLIEKISERVYKDGDSFVIPEFAPHNIFSEESSLYVVYLELKKDKS